MTRVSPGDTLRPVPRYPEGWASHIRSGSTPGAAECEAPRVALTVLGGQRHEPPCYRWGHWWNAPASRSRGVAGPGLGRRREPRLSLALIGQAPAPGSRPSPGVRSGPPLLSRARAPAPRSLSPTGDQASPSGPGSILNPRPWEQVPAHSPCHPAADPRATRHR